jgi:AAA domain/UvrD-like helicase C-terminal domain
MNDEEMAQSRAQNLERVLSSDARHKVIVAGPGTGKSFTFKRVLDRMEGPVLVLSFLNMLVVDLERSLGDRAVVRTFHAYCRGLLQHMDVPGITRGVDYFPNFQAIIDEDIQLIRDSVPDDGVERSLMHLDDTDGLATAALGIGNYYDAVGHTDSVYRVHLALTAEPRQVPILSQILVDEYQDFSLLEASLIYQLSTQSPTLIAGDDDQALYSFRHASADYLRDLVNGGTYQRFELPFCTRCTQVLVDATHRVVEHAQQIGLLGNRIDKQYICYLPEKRAVSEQYPVIRHVNCTVERNSAPYICRFVAQEIGRIDASDIAVSHAEGNPTVLVIAPSQFGRRIYDHLRNARMPNVGLASRQPTAIEILDGYKRLAEDERSRLGWRLVLHTVHPPGWQDAVRRALLEDLELVDLLPQEFRDLHLSIVALLRVVLQGEELPKDELGKLGAATGLPLSALRRHLGLEMGELEPELDQDAPRILITTLSGAKGLQAEHVFVVGVNEGHFPRVNSAPREDEVCQLLVALTRARRSCTLVSCGHFGGQLLRQSVFIRWLTPLLETVQVNAAYWNR